MMKAWQCVLLLVAFCCWDRGEGQEEEVKLQRKEADSERATDQHDIPQGDKDKATSTDCGFRIPLLWKSHLRGSPIKSTPALYDIDRDGYNDILVASTAGELWAIHGESGHVIDNWPLLLEGRSFHGSPLLYDIDADGHDEIVLVTSDAEVVFVHDDGSLAHGETIKLPPVKVKRAWYSLSSEEQEQLQGQLDRQMQEAGHGLHKTVSPPTTKSRKAPANPDSHQSLYGRVPNTLDSRHEYEEWKSGVDQSDESMVFVDPHVLATPLLTDTNGDGSRDELVVPVSYYFDAYYYGDEFNLEATGLERDELQNYIAGGLVNIDLTTGKILWQRFLGITRGSSGQPAFVLVPPTPLKRRTSDVFDVLIGTAKGELHFINGLDGSEVKGFPTKMDSITTQVVVGDVDSDGVTDILVSDESGNIQCLSIEGTMKWEQHVGAAIAGGLRLGDLEGKDKMDIAVVTQDGSLHIVHGHLGEMKGVTAVFGERMSAPPLLLSLTGGPGRTVTKGLLVPSQPSTRTRPKLHFYHAKKDCMHNEELEGGSYVSILAGKVMPHRKGVEILISLHDGTVVCYGFEGTESDFHLDNHSSNYWPAEVPFGNQFTHKSHSVFIEPISPSLLPFEVTSRSFDIEFELSFGGLSPPPQQYSVEVSMGRGHKLHKQVLNVGAGMHHEAVQITIPTPNVPIMGLVELRVCTMDGAHCDLLHYNIKFNLHYEDNLKWCLSIPFICLCLSILWFVRDAKAPVDLPMTASLGADTKLGKRSTD